MKMNRIDCSKKDPQYFYYNYNYNNNAQVVEEKENKKDTNLNLNNSNSSTANKQNLSHVKSNSSLLNKIETAANTQRSLDPFVALEKLCSISANVKKKKQN